MSLSLSRRWANAVRSARNILLDLRYGGLAGGYIRNRYPGATGVASTDYGLMSQIFGGRVRDDDVLVEVGCGKGRVINWWLAQGYRNRIVGLEIMEEVADKTRARLRRFPNVTILAGDAIQNLPPDGTLFYLANPFDSVELMGRFMARFRADSSGCGMTCGSFTGRAFTREILFREDPAWELEEIELKMPAAGKFEERHKHLALVRLRRR